MEHVDRQRFRNESLQYLSKRHLPQAGPLPFNFGFGLEHHFSPDVAGYLSYHTDVSGRPSDAPPDASVTAWDLNHVTAGVTFNAWRSNFAVGASAAFGSRPIPGSGSRPDRIPPASLDSQALIVTGTLGWKFTF